MNRYRNGHAHGCNNPYPHEIISSCARSMSWARPCECDECVTWDRAAREIGHAPLVQRWNVDIDSDNPCIELGTE